MAKFAEWMVAKAHEDAGAKSLNKHIKKNTEKWAKISSLEAAQELINGDENESEDSKSTLTKALEAAWIEYAKETDSAGGQPAAGSKQNNSPGAQQKKTLRQLVAENASVIVVGFLALAIFLFLVRAIFDDQFLVTLANEEVVRGLITFFFALGTIGVAVILVAAAFTNGDDNLSERFDMGKQVLTALIGVLGTIVGFYFGTGLNGSENNSNGNSQVVEAATQDQIVAWLNSQIDEINKQIEEKTPVVADLQGQFDELSKTVAELQNTDPENQLPEKSKELEELKKKLDEENKALETLKNQEAALGEQLKVADPKQTAQADG